MKKFFVTLIALIICATTVHAAQPVRIARLPIIFNSTTPDRDTCAELEMKIARAVHVPLNKTLQVAEYLPTKDSAQALSDIWQRLRAEDKRAKLADAMRPLARQLDADIVVCPILLRYSQNVLNMSGWDETIIDCHARAELIVYDRRTDTLLDKKAAQIYRDSYHPIGTASSLAKICFDKIIDETNLRHLITAIGK